MTQFFFGRIFLLLLLISVFLAFQTNTFTKKTDASKISKLLKEKEDFIKNGQYRLAIDKLIAIKDLYLEDQNWEKVVAYYNDAVRLSDNLEDEGNKEVYAQKALKLARKHLPNNHLETAKALQLQGEILFSYQKFDSTILYTKLAADIFLEQKEWEDNAWATITLAVVSTYTEEYDNMKTYLDEVELLAKDKKLSNEFFDAIYNLLGTYYFYTSNNYEKAIEVTLKALELALTNENKSVVDSLNISNIHYNLGAYYFSKGNLNRSAHYYKQSLVVLNNLPLYSNENSDLLESYAKVQLHLGKEREAINICKQLNNQTIMSYLLLCNSYDNLGQIDSAFFYIKKSIQLAKEKDLISKENLIFLGKLQYQKGNLNEAIKNLEKAIVLNTDFSFMKLPHTNMSFNLLGEIYTSQKNYPLALQNYQKAIATNISNFTDTLNLYDLPTNAEPYRIDYLIETLKNKALTLKAMNTPKTLKAAFETNQLAIQCAEKMRQDFAFEEAKVNLNEQTTELYEAAIEIAYQLYQSTNEPTYLEAAFVVAEKQKGILLLESLIDEKGKKHYQVPQHLLERERQLKTDIAFYKQKIVETEQTKDTTKHEMYQNYYTNFNIEFGNLKDTLRTYYKTYFDLEYQASIATITSIQKKLLQPEQAFIQYLTTDSLFYVFGIEKEKSHFLALRKGEKETKTLQQLQALLHNPKALNTTEQGTFEEFTTLAHQSYQQVLEPLTSRLSSNIRELIIVPDEGLNYLPFETLLGEAVATTEADYMRLPYLLRKYQFHYGYSGTLLLENQNQYDAIKTNDEILAFAPPYKEEMPIALQGGLATLRGSIGQLKGTAKEIQAISAYFDGEFDFSKSATKENFKKQAGDYGILHLAMHGQPSLEEPDYAYMIFSNVENDTAQSNLLHHYEITALETKAQLAVLSACETGVGKDLEGEGVMSLGRGFMYAGIPSVVMSLWKMNDQSTSELIPLFYKNLAAGMRKDKALHQAKLEYLDNAVAERAAPFYWAGFVSLGDMQPIKKANTSNWLWWLGGVGTLLILFLGFRFLKFRQ